jgi:hypothetical protein
VVVGALAAVGVVRLGIDGGPVAVGTDRSGPRPRMMRTGLRSAGGIYRNGTCTGLLRD